MNIFKKILKIESAYKNADKDKAEFEKQMMDAGQKSTEELQKSMMETYSNFNIRILIQLYHGSGYG